MTAFRTALRATTVGVAAILIGCSSAAPPPASKPAPDPVAQAPAPAPVAQAALPTWPSQGSDLVADPSVTIGVLPNGMRYAVKRNALPAGQVALRFMVNAGSMQEQDDQRGLAHFLEHMAFAGSTHVAESETFKIMERLGASFGADTNASTSQTATIYQFNMPKSDDESVDTALMLFRETASELLLDQGAMDRERGVVLSEERTRASPTYRAAAASCNLFFGGHPYSLMPIGDVKVLQTAPVSRIKAFYDAFYRPERTTLVIAGDVDPAAIEAKIKAKFSDWKGRGAPGKDPAPMTVPAPGSKVQAFIETGVQPQVLMTWLKPLDTSPETLAKAKREAVENMAMSLLNRRFSDVVQKPNPPFLAAFTGKSPVPGVIDTLQLASAGATKMEAAMVSMETIQRQAVEFGFRQDELDRAITDTRVRMQAAVAGTSTRLTQAVIAELQGRTQQGKVFRSAQQELDLFNEVAPTLKLADVNAAIKTAFGGSGPLVFATGSEQPAGGEEAIRSAFDAAAKAPLTALAAEPDKPWVYTDFGKPGAVASKTEDKELGLTFVKFANGVRLTVKPTDFAKDQVQVRVMFGNGELDLPKDKMSPIQMWTAAYVSGGLGKMTAIERQRAFTGKTANIAANVAEGGFVLAGNPRPQDFKLQMQLLAAYVTDPAWKPTDYESGRGFMINALPLMDRDPMQLWSLKSDGLLHNGDPRWAEPTPEFLKATNVADIQKAMAPIIAKADLEVVIVGDVKVEDAISETAATFGALPKRDARKEPVGAREAKFPAGTPEPIILTHKGRADQALAVIAWPTTDHWKDMNAVGDARVLQIIIVNRMLDQLREKQAKAYSVSGDVEFSKIYTNYGLLQVEAPVSPDSVADFFKDIDDIVADLKAKPPTQDEVDRAIRPRKEELARTFKTNAYWSTVLLGVQLEPRRLADVRLGSSALDKVTPASVQAAAKKWLVPEKAWKLAIKPAPAAAKPQ